MLQMLWPIFLFFLSFTSSLAAQCTSPVPGDDTTLLQTAELAKRDHAGPTKIPCVIHQTWKNNLIVGKHKRWVQTWLRMNPSCEHKLWTDAQLEELARTKSPDVIWPIWGGLSPIERADVFRYLVLWDQGGYYADLDVTSVKAIKDYDIPKEATMIVGYELPHRLPESAREDNTMIRTEQFENWFLASAPGSPVLLRCLQMVREKFGWKIQSALDLTGPGTLSDAVHEFLERSNAEGDMAREVSFRQSRAQVRRHYSHYLSYPSEKLYGTGEWKLWILAAGRVNYHPNMAEEDPTEAKEPIVEHHFEGSWKPAHGGRLGVRRH